VNLLNREKEKKDLQGKAQSMVWIRVVLSYCADDDGSGKKA
jgi:hypothetical protein